MKLNMRLTKIEKSMMNTYLLLTFSIAWGTELLLILLYRLPLSSSAFLQVLYYIGLGFGCGMAPAYAAFIVERKCHGMMLRSFLRKVIETHSMKRCLGVLLLFGLIQFCACALQERYTGNPCYLFVLFMPLMIYGGGMEEVGWQGILQPLLQKRFPFLIAVLIEGAVWSIWHLPLWFIPGRNPGRSAQDYQKYLGIRSASCLVKYRLGWNVYSHVTMQLSQYKNSYNQRNTNIGSYGTSISYENKTITASRYNYHTLE